MSAELMLRDGSVATSPDGDLDVRFEDTVNTPIDSITWRANGQATAGTYVLEVKPLNEEAEPGSYRIELERLMAVATTPEEKVDQMFMAWDRPESPGAAVAVVKDGQAVYNRGFGSANLEHGVPITPTTVFDIASVSKQFAGLAIAILATQGKIDLDARIPAESLVRLSVTVSAAFRRGGVVGIITGRAKRAR